VKKATKIAVLGAGSWGTALALALSRNQHQVTLWGHQVSHCNDMIKDGSNNKYLTNFGFPNNLCVDSNLSNVVNNHNTFLIVTPSHAFRSTVKKLKDLGVSKEVAENLPTAITVASNNAITANLVAGLFHGQNMRVYTNSDLIGVLRFRSWTIH